MKSPLSNIRIFIRLHYIVFQKVAARVPEKARQFFSATVFGKLQQRDPYGRVPIVTVFNYVMRKTWLRQSRIGLSLYDINGQGYLTEKVSAFMPRNFRQSAFCLLLFSLLSLVFLSCRRWM